MFETSCKVQAGKPSEWSKVFIWTVCSVFFSRAREFVATHRQRFVTKYLDDSSQEIDDITKHVLMVLSDIDFNNIIFVSVKN